MKHELCKLSAVPDSGTILLPFFGREIHVWQTPEGIRAAANTCLHFGGPLEYRDGQLTCPWHGAAFDMATGACRKGPAPANSRLLFVSTRVEGDALFYVWGE